MPQTLQVLENSKKIKIQNWQILQTLKTTKFERNYFKNIFMENSEYNDKRLENFVNFV
jgi:hypothetical protein